MNKWNKNEFWENRGRERKGGRESSLLRWQAGFGQSVSNVPQMSGQVASSGILGKYLLGLTHNLRCLPGKLKEKNKEVERGVSFKIAPFQRQQPVTTLEISPL